MANRTDRSGGRKVTGWEPTIEGPKAPPNRRSKQMLRFTAKLWTEHTLMEEGEDKWTQKGQEPYKETKKTQKSELRGSCRG